MNTRYTGDEDATPEEREAAYDAHQDRMLDEQKEREAEAGPAKLAAILVATSLALNQMTVEQREAMCNVSNRRAKFPTRLKEGDKP